MTSLRIALADESDAAEFLEIYTPYVLNTAVTFEYEPPSREEFASRIREVREFYPYLKCVDGDRVIGYAYSSRSHPRKAYQWNLELSVYLRIGMTGAGLGRALYHALIEFAKLQYMHTLYGILGLPNEPSERLHRRLGFERVCLLPRAGYKLGEWRDVAWYCRRIAEGAPREPRAFAAIPEADVTRVLAESLDILK